MKYVLDLHPYFSFELIRCVDYVRSCDFFKFWLCWSVVRSKSMELQPEWTFIIHVKVSEFDTDFTTFSEGFAYVWL